MWRTHKARGETSSQALSGLPVARCRIRGISNGNNLVQCLFLIPPPMEEQYVFSNSILCLRIWQLGDGKWIKTTAECLLYRLHLLDKSPQCLWSPRCRYSPPASVCCPQHHSPALSADSQEGVAFITAVQGARLQWFLSAIPSPGLRFSSSYSFTSFFLFMQVRGKNKTNEVDSFSLDRKVINQHQ